MSLSCPAHECLPCDWLASHLRVPMSHASWERLQGDTDPPLNTRLWRTAEHRELPFTEASKVYVYFVSLRGNSPGLDPQSMDKHP